MKIEEVRNIIENNIKYNTKWKHIFTTNCYAFALGLDIRENKVIKNAYNPGNISNRPKITTEILFSYNHLIKNLKSDLELLNIDIRDINYNDKIDKDEWKIALFLRKINIDYLNLDLLFDFHFLREYKNGLWIHKEGYYHYPTNKDSNKRIITNPEDCYIKNYTFDKCYALKLKKDFK